MPDELLTSAVCVDKRLAKELLVASSIGRGKSKGARLVQEYLWINGFKPTIDGDWGDGTQAALDAFCDAKRLPRTSSVDQSLMDRMAQPLLRAAKPVAPAASLGATVVSCALQQLAEHPIEIGGANAGPWVRFYMDGNEGKDWLWCAGFATRIVLSCAKLLGQSTAIKRTYSCDVLAMSAKAAGTFRKGSAMGAIPPGSLFLVPSSKSSSDWIHTGIVLEQSGTVVRTAEGNTNSGGSSNGFEATQRIRNATKLDFVLLQP